MKLENILTELAGCCVGSVIHLKGYKGTEGGVSDLTVRLVVDDWYQNAKIESLEIIEDASLPEIPGVSEPDLHAARAELVSRLSKNQAGGEVINLPETDRFLRSEDSIYLVRLELLSDVSLWLPPKKKHMARCIQDLTLEWNLPVARYIHRLKLADDKVLEVKIEP